MGVCSSDGQRKEKTWGNSNPNENNNSGSNENNKPNNEYIMQKRNE